MKINSKFGPFFINKVGSIGFSVSPPSRALVGPPSEPFKALALAKDWCNTVANQVGQNESDKKLQQMQKDKRSK